MNHRSDNCSPTHFMAVAGSLGTGETIGPRPVEIPFIGDIARRLSQKVIISTREWWGLVPHHSFGRDKPCRYAKLAKYVINSGHSLKYADRVLRQPPRGGVKATQTAVGGRKRTSHSRNSISIRKYEDYKMLRRTLSLWCVLAVLLGSLVLSGMAAAQGTGSICGRKFHDENGNGQYDGEPGLQNFEIKLRYGNTFIKTVYTGPQGYYCFNNLAAGLYTVHEVQKAYDFVAQTYPTTVFYTIDLLDGEARTGVDFGNDSLCDGEISYDSCLNGTEDNFVGPEFSYVSPEFAQWMTDNNPIPYDQYFDNGTNDKWFGHTFDSCWSDTCEVISATLCMRLRTTGGGSANDWLYLGDWSQDGRIWSASLTDLWQSNGGSGQWSGQEMVLCLDLENLPLNRPLGSDIIAAVQDGNLDILIEDDTEVDWINMVVELCCDSISTDDSLGSICGQKFHDVNGNHQYDAGEPGIQGFDINLYEGNVLVGTETTDYWGYYCFNYLPAGQYTVHEESQPLVYTAQTFPTTVFHTIDLQPNEALADINFGNDSICDGEISYDSCLNGTEDNFVGPEFSFVSPELAQWMTDNSTIPYEQDFDGGTHNQWFGHTFTNCWSDSCEVISATLSMHIRPTGTDADNDWLFLGDWSQDGRIWSTPLATFPGWPGDITITLDLENLPANPVLGSDIIAAVQDGNLDILIQDDTEVDWIYMVVELCCDSSCGDLNEVINTGWDQFGGQLIPWGDPDDDWRLVGTPNGQVDEPAQVSNISYGGNPPNTEWLGVIPNWVGDGDYWFEYTFCLNPGYSNPELNVEMIGGETMWLYLNGNLVYGPLPPLTGIGTWTTDPNFFQSGTNRVRIRINSTMFGGDGSVFALAGTVFADNGECCDTGACCDTMRVCYQTDRKTCLKDDGVFFGKNSNCVNVDCDTCFANGDIDGDGLIFTVADKIYLMNFVQGVGAPPIPLYQGDLNADGYIDQLDIDMIDCYFTIGMSCFPQYPIPVDCFPSVMRGACCDIGQTCTILSPDNCAANNGYFWGLGTTCNPDPCPIEDSCVGIRGNVDGDPSDEINVADLTYLVDYLFNGGPVPPYSKEADVNGDGSTDVSDLTYLVDYLFRGGNPPPSCNAISPPAGKVREDVILGYEYREGSTIVWLESSIDIKGVMLEYSGEQSEEPARLIDGSFELLYHSKDSKEARIGLVDLTGQSIIKAGTHRLVSIPGQHEITVAMLSNANHHTVIPTIRMVSKGSGLPTQFSLSQNYPNPFNPSTSILFSLPEASDVRLEVFNVLGRKVATLAEERFEAGEHTVDWDASSVSSGMYLYRLTAGDFTETKKMLLLK